MTPAETNKLLTVLMAAYQTRYDDPEMLAEVYERMWADLPYETAAAAVHAHIASRKYFPRVSEIREAVIRGQLLLPSAPEAFAMLGTQTMLPKLVRQAYEFCGGHWERTNTRETLRWRAQFCKTYEELVAAEVQRTNEQWLLSAHDPVQISGAVS